MENPECELRLCSSAVHCPLPDICVARSLMFGHHPSWATCLELPAAGLPTIFVRLAIRSNVQLYFIFYK